MTFALRTCGQVGSECQIHSTGVIDWLARGADRRGMIAVLAGNFIVQLLSLLVVLRTMQLGAGAAVLPGVIIHIVLGSLFIFFLLRARQLAA